MNCSACPGPSEAAKDEHYGEREATAWEPPPLVEPPGRLSPDRDEAATLAPHRAPLPGTGDEGPRRRAACASLRAARTGRRRTQTALRCAVIVVGLSGASSIMHGPDGAHGHGANRCLPLDCTRGGEPVEPQCTHTELKTHHRKQGKTVPPPRSESASTYGYGCPRRLRLAPVTRC